MNSTQINCFLTAADCLNFTAAAEKLGISQPTLSRNIASLEREVGFGLFHRHNNVLALTRGGDLLHRELRDIGQKLADSIARASRLEGADVLRLGFVRSDFPTSRMIEKLKAFRKHRPQVTLEIIHDNWSGLVSRLKNKSLDAAVMMEKGVSEGSGLEHVNLEPVRLQVAMSACQGPRENAGSLLTFSGDRFLSIRKEVTPRMTELLMDACRDQGFVPEIVEASGIDELTNWLAEGYGVTLLPRTHKAYYNPLLRFVEPRELPDEYLSCVWNPAGVSRVTGDFIDLAIA